MDCRNLQGAAEAEALVLEVEVRAVPAESQVVATSAQVVVGVVARRECREGTGRPEPPGPPPGQSRDDQSHMMQPLLAREGSSLPDRAGARPGR